MGNVLKNSASAVLAILASESGSSPGPIARFGAAARRVFPLGFGGQAVGVAVLLAEPFAERDGVVPGDVDDGLIVGNIKAGIFPVVLGIAAFEDLLLLIEAPAAGAAASVVGLLRPAFCSRWLRQTV